VIILRGNRSQFLATVVAKSVWVFAFLSIAEFLPIQALSLLR
jgi:hypothetical protein